MLKQTIKKWNQSIEFYENGNVGEALKTLYNVESSTSKINYNIGVMNIKNNSYKNAIEYFNKSIEQDKYLAASFFMRAISHHMSGELNHAIVDYDETISKLRGHEYIDYKQLGLDHKLLLAEVLFNKALALGRAGSSVALQAAQCLNQPSDSNEFKAQCKKIQDGSQLNFSTRPIPLNLLFRPPKVSDGPPKPRSATTTSTPSPPLSTSPNNFILKGPSTSSAATPPRPPTQSSKPSFGSSPSSASPPMEPSSPPSIQSMIAGKTPPKPPPLPSKKLPSRPISCVAQEVKITLKIFYETDRRLIQIPVPCNFSTFKQKIELKFDIKLTNDKHSLSYELDGNDVEIISQVQLDNMICMEINEINIRDVIPDYSNPYEEKPKSSYIPRPINTSQNNQHYTLPRQPIPTATQSPSPNYNFTKPLSNTPVGPPLPSRNSPPTNSTTPPIPFKNSPPIPTSSRPNLTQSHSPPKSAPYATYSKPISISSSYSGGGFKSPPITPYPYKVMFSNGEKYYLNQETNETYWTIPE